MVIPKILQSSQSPGKISLTLKAVIPLIAFVLPLFGLVDVTPENLGQMADGIEKFIAAVGGAISAALFLWGLIRKFIPKE